MKRTEIAENNISASATRSRRISAPAALVACVIATLPSTGCRSGKSSWNMFSRNEPSAEVLAGSGPTTTYPSPPSTRARPEAIASIAGGTATDKPTDAAQTPETIAPASGENPYALAGNRLKTTADGLPAGFPTGPASKDDPHPIVSTSLAADGGSVPPSYALPGRTGQKASSDLAATANGYDGVPAATTPSKPQDAAGLPSGYQLGKHPVAESNTALASQSPAASPTPFSMPPLSDTASFEPATRSGSTAPAKSGGFGLPSELMSPPVTNIANADASAASAVKPEGGSSADNTAVAALDLPPSQPSPLGSSSAESSASKANVSGGTSKSPEFQTASAAKSPSGSPSAGASPSSVQPTGYMPGSTGKSSAYPMMR